MKADFVCTAVGTAVTVAGLYAGRTEGCKVLAVPVLKNMTDIPQRIKFLTGLEVDDELLICDDHHFGGYAKYDASLIEFMNGFYQRHNIPSDFVYPAKLFHAVHQLIQADHFPRGSKILMVHTGGLLGNAGLPAGSLIF